MRDCSILLVEDSPTQACAMQAILAGAGFRVTLAASLQMALDRLSRSQPDLVLTGLHLPDGTGCDLCERLQGGSVPCALLGYLDRAEVVASGVRSGACAVLPKTFDSSVLLPKLESLLAPARTDSRRILLVEDDLICRLAAEGMLQALGHQVTTAENGREALDFDPADFDLILMDLEMPEMDGFATAPELLGRPHCPALVALSGHDREETRRRCRVLGFAECLTKPLSESALQSLIGRLATRTTRL